jgi:hypothetical protein
MKILLLYTQEYFLKYNPMKYYNLSKVKPILLFFLTFALLAISDSCKRATEKTSEKALEKSIGNEARVDIEDEKITIKTEEGTFTTDATVHSWPGEIPDDVPEFKNGKVISVSKQETDGNNNWVVIFEEVSEGDLEKYKKDLEDSGFKINYTTMAGSGGYLYAMKNNLSVVVMVGEGNATVTIGTGN